MKAFGRTLSYRAFGTSPQDLNTLLQQPVMQRTAQRESSARSYNRRFPISIEKAEGVYVYDAFGTKYLDALACAGTLALGHNHPLISNTIQKFISEKRPTQLLDLITPIKDNFVTQLFECLPTEFRSKARVQFCGPAGTDAVEAAMKLAKTATGRNNIIAFHGGYHGHSNGALSLMGNIEPKGAAPGLALMPGVHFFPFPYSYRCPFGLGGDKGAEMCSRYIEHVLEDVESGIVKPAAVIVEVVQGEGGVVPAHDEWMRRLRAVTKKHGILLICDEIQTGFGRTGKMFAHEYSGITPDIICVSKALGGSMPLAAVLYDKALDVWGPGAHAGTFRGNQLAMACGAAALQLIRQDKMPEAVQAKGARLRKHLEKTAAQVSCIGEVRGRGLMLGVEIVSKKGSSGSPYPADGKMAAAIQAECFKRNMIVEKGGRHSAVVRFLPPLIISDAEIDEAAGIFDQAVKAVSQTSS